MKIRTAIVLLTLAFSAVSAHAETINSTITGADFSITGDVPTIIGTFTYSLPVGSVITGLRIYSPLYSFEASDGLFALEFGFDEYALLSLPVWPGDKEFFLGTDMTDMVPLLTWDGTVQLWIRCWLGTSPGTYTYVAGDYWVLAIDFEITSPPQPETVAIDIKPGSHPNSINLKSKGVVPVAIITTPEFDASTADPTTVIFADASPIRWTTKDVDYDGDMDMLLHFKVQELGLDERSFKATLTGMTYDGGAILGTDSIRIVVPEPPPTCMQPPEGFTGWWPGDGNTDDIIGCRNAELQGDATTGPGFVGEAFILDGDGDFVNVPQDPALNVGYNDFTVALWAFFNDTAGEQVLAEKYIQRFDEDTPCEGWTLTKWENNVLQLVMVDGGDGSGIEAVSEELRILTGTWYHFAATREGSTLTIYMNGLPVAITEEALGLNADSESSLKFGHRGNPGDTPGSDDDRGCYLNGGIDEAQIFVGRALSPDQIKAIFAAGRAGICKERY